MLPNKGHKRIGRPRPLPLRSSADEDSVSANCFFFVVVVITLVMLLDETCLLLAAVVMCSINPRHTLVLVQFESTFQLCSINFYPPTVPRSIESKFISKDVNYLMNGIWMWSVSVKGVELEETIDGFSYHFPHTFQIVYVKMAFS